AFGCVLFEMLSGRRAFGGVEVTDTLAFVITKEPEWSALPVATRRPLIRLLRRCLAKDPADRLHDMGDARLEINDALADPVNDAAPVALQPPPFWTWARVAVVALAVIAAAAVGAVMARWQLRPAPVRVTRFG